MPRLFKEEKFDMEDYYFDSSIPLDYEAERRNNQASFLNYLETRLEYWRERQNEQYLKLYRSITSI